MVVVVVVVNFLSHSFLPLFFPFFPLFSPTSLLNLPELIISITPSSIVPFILYLLLCSPLIHPFNSLFPSIINHLDQ